MKAILLGVLCVALVVAVGPEGTNQCRTRTPAEIASASPQRAVWTPAVRKGSMISNSFFNAAELAGLLGDGRSLPNMLPCVIAPPEHQSAQATFRAVRGGISAKVAFPESIDCQDERGTRVSNLRDVRGEILIVGHGNAAEPRLDIAFGNAGTTERESFTPDEMAELLVENGLACDHKQITILQVQGGLRLSKQGANKRFIELYRKMQAAKGDASEEAELRGDWGALAMRARDPDVFENNDNIADKDIPFVAMLASALATRGYLGITVSGFRGEVLSRLGARPTNPGPYSGLKVYVTAGMLAESLCSTEASHTEKIRCQDQLLAPCDECLLKSSKSKAGFLKRAKHCQRVLLKSSNPTTRRAAQVCGAEAAYATKQWLFSVNSNEVKDTEIDD